MGLRSTLGPFFFGKLFMAFQVHCAYLKKTWVSVASSFKLIQVFIKFQCFN
jgi:hypothetical protein